MGDMSPEFAIRILQGAKVAPIPKIHGNPILYGYQNQKFYDIARKMAIAAIRENAALKERIRELEGRQADERDQKHAGTADPDRSAGKGQ